MYRFKTGTPARIDKRSIDFSQMEEQFGDEKVVPFSFTTDRSTLTKPQVSCFLTYTNEGWVRRTKEGTTEACNRSRYRRK